MSWDPLAPSLAAPFDELREEEKAGTIPSLVFTPMLVEDGRQLIISNLDLDYMVDWGSLTDPGAPNVVAGAGAETARSPTVSAVEFYRLFPGAVGKFRLGTAVRLNATFPVFSPAPELPTNPPRRVVDAGYYDNYGLVVASRWIERNRDWFLTFDRPVWVVQLWAYGYSQQSGALTTGPEQELLDAGDPRAVPDHALRTSSLPIGALFAAWNTSMANRGEERINKVLYRLNFDRQEENKDRVAGGAERINSRVSHGPTYAAGPHAKKRVSRSDSHVRNSGVVGGQCLHPGITSPTACGTCDRIRLTAKSPGNEMSSAAPSTRTGIASR